MREYGGFTVCGGRERETKRIDSFDSPLLSSPLHFIPPSHTHTHASIATTAQSTRHIRFFHHPTLQLITTLVNNIYLCFLVSPLSVFVFTLFNIFSISLHFMSPYGFMSLLDSASSRFSIHDKQNQHSNSDQTSHWVRIRNRECMQRACYLWPIYRSLNSQFIVAGYWWW